MEALMRNLALAILTIGIVSPAAAQMYDPAYPVCLRLDDRTIYYECSYTSLPQCNASASGRAAQVLHQSIFRGRAAANGLSAASLGLLK
jgi:hypothetical protein